MYKKFSTDEAIKLLKDDEHGHWSWDGAKALVEYLGELEGDIGNPIEMDRVALRGDFSEYDSALEAAEYHDFIPADDEDEDEIEAYALKYLVELTTVIQFEGGIIIQEF